MAWEENEVAMKPLSLLKDIDVPLHIYQMYVEDSPTIRKAGSRKIGKFLMESTNQ
jgi:hypothetical protein